MAADKNTAGADRGVVLLLAGAVVLAALWVYAIAAHRLGGYAFGVGLPVVTGIHMWRWLRFGWLKRRDDRS
jgi:hypothetical protein